MNYKETLDFDIEKIKIKSYLQKFDIEEVRNEIFEGLSANQKYISSKFFYDEKGSQLFEQITKLEEYYPGRTEKEILKTIDLSFINNFEKLNIFELGSGDHSKISLILNQIPNLYLKSLVYHPIDISKSAIQLASEKLLKIYPEISIQAYVADFTHQLNIIPKNENRLFCFLGSTIGNFTYEKSLDFLKEVNKIMSNNDYFLLGLDTIKERETYCIFQ
jgi:L-histidine N-alpha-methyltransferase